MHVYHTTFAIGNGIVSIINRIKIGRALSANFINVPDQDNYYLSQSTYFYLISYIKVYSHSRINAQRNTDTILHSSSSSSPSPPSPPLPPFTDEEEYPFETTGRVQHCTYTLLWSIIIFHGTYRYLVHFPYQFASFPRCSGIIANQYQRNVPPTQFRQRALECNISLLRYIK